MAVPSYACKGVSYMENETVHNPTLGVCYCDSNMTFHISTFITHLLTVLTKICSAYSL